MDQEKYQEIIDDRNERAKNRLSSAQKLDNLLDYNEEERFNICASIIMQMQNMDIESFFKALVSIEEGKKSKAMLNALYDSYINGSYSLLNEKIPDKILEINYANHLEDISKYE